MNTLFRRAFASVWYRVNHLLPVRLVKAVLPSFNRSTRHSLLRPWLPTLGYAVGQRPVGSDIVMLTISNLLIDPRIEREARTLAAAGHSVTVIAPNPMPGEEDPDLDWGDGIQVDWVDPSAVTFAGEWPGFLGKALYNAAIGYTPFAFHAHDLFTAFVGLSAAKKTGAHLVCDFHEWGSENVKWQASHQAWLPYPAVWKIPLIWLEKICFRNASEVVTVSDSIADAMACELGKGRRPVVVRNIPALALRPTVEYPPLREQLNIADGQFVVLWQGGTGPTRLIEPVIEALQYVPDCTLVIRGPSLDEYGPDYRKLAEKVGASERLVLERPVPSRDVVAAARGADAGIWTLPDLCRNFRLALPNKIFEYLAAGVPILVADYPEARKVALDLGVGATFDPYNPRAIAASIKSLMQNRKLRDQMAQATKPALSAVHANNEWDKIAEIYSELLERTAT